MVPMVPDFMVPGERVRYAVCRHIGAKMAPDRLKTPCKKLREDWRCAAQKRASHRCGDAAEPEAHDAQPSCASGSLCFVQHRFVIRIQDNQLALHSHVNILRGDGLQIIGELKLDADSLQAMAQNLSYRIKIAG